MEMKIHLDSDIFDIVENGTKTVEARVNDEKDDTNNDTEKSPETGLTSITTALLITMLLSIIAYVVFKKKNLFKRV